MANKWLLISGGDGYSTEIVVGQEALEQAFLKLLLGDPCDMSAENVSEGECHLKHLRDTDQNWLHNYQFGPVEYTLRLEDGHIHVFRLVDEDELRTADMARKLAFAAGKQT